MNKLVLILFVFLNNKNDVLFDDYLEEKYKKTSKIIPTMGCSDDISNIKDFIKKLYNIKQKDSEKLAFPSQIVKFYEENVGDLNTVSDYGVTLNVVLKMHLDVIMDRKEIKRDIKFILISKK